MGDRQEHEGGCGHTAPQEESGVPRIDLFLNQKFMIYPYEATGQASWQRGAFVPVGLGRGMLTSKRESGLIIHQSCHGG